MNIDAGGSCWARNKTTEPPSIVQSLSPGEGLKPSLRVWRSLGHKASSIQKPGQTKWLLFIPREPEFPLKCHDDHVPQHNRSVAVSVHSNAPWQLCCAASWFMIFGTECAICADRHRTRWLSVKVYERQTDAVFITIWKILGRKTQISHDKSGEDAWVNGVDLLFGNMLINVFNSLRLFCFVVEKYWLFEEVKWVFKLFVFSMPYVGCKSLVLVIGVKLKVSSHQWRGAGLCSVVGVSSDGGMENESNDWRVELSSSRPRSMTMFMALLSWAGCLSSLINSVCVRSCAQSGIKKDSLRVCMFCSKTLYLRPIRDSKLP